ncbi:MAG: L-aspartate oxidase [Planctomycetes bacterium]|nr:L-aspartate oxidase [Planctomycetota bacterium]
MDPSVLHPFVPTSPLGRLQLQLRSLPVYRAEVLVIGSGVAGLSAALTAADLGKSVMVLSKGALSSSNTAHAQGGMAAALGPDDCADFHAGDTVDVGYGLCDARVVEEFTHAGPEAVRWLLKAGMQFDRDPSGNLAMGMEGGHRVARVLHSGGAATGQELQRVLSARGRNHRHIDLFENLTAVELLKDEDGRVRGLLALRRHANSRRADPVLFEADSVIMATGGGGQIFRETTNPELATADGVAMAMRAGAKLQDLEFVQFHPTILYLAGAARFLISEITRGAGAVLRDSQGVAFMESAHPRKDLAPRDVVSRAIFRRMLELEDTNVFLDLTDVDNPEARFPGLARITREFGMEMARDLIPVRPAVHYMVGGVQSDLDGRTSIPGLFAVGECACTGFHGANRMGSNSLLEGLVHGRLIGKVVAEETPALVSKLALPDRGRKPLGSAQLNLTDMTYSLKSLMWRQVGIEREHAGLEDACSSLQAWEGFLSRLGPFTPEGIEVVNMVQVGAAITYSALFRQESRGTHFRTDYPDTIPGWQIHSVLTSDSMGLNLAAKAVVGSDCTDITAEVPTL